MFYYVLGILYGVAMLWFDVLKRKVFIIVEKKISKKMGGHPVGLQCFLIFNTNNNTIYIFTQETN